MKLRRNEAFRRPDIHSFPQITASGVLADRICVDGHNRIFHGKNFIKEHVDDYRQFLREIRQIQIVENNPPYLLAFILMDESWKKKHVPFSRRLVKGSMIAAHISDPKIEAVLERLTPSLFKLQRILCNLPESKSVKIEVDQDKITKNFSQMSTFMNQEHLTCKLERFLEVSTITTEGNGFLDLQGYRGMAFKS